MKDVLRNWVCPIGLLSRIKYNFTLFWGISFGGFNSIMVQRILNSVEVYVTFFNFQKSVLYMKLKIILIRKCIRTFHYHLNSWAARDLCYTTGYTEATESSSVVSRDDNFPLYYSCISLQPAMVYANQAKTFFTFEVIMHLSLITFAWTTRINDWLDWYILTYGWRRTYDVERTVSVASV